jgi:hypothetical protein
MCFIPIWTEQPALIPFLQAKVANGQLGMKEGFRKWSAPVAEAVRAKLLRFLISEAKLKA